MTSRQTAVPAREPARGGTAGRAAPSGAWDGPALARLLLIALLVAGVLVGLRGGFALHGWRGPYHRDGIAIGAGLEVVLAGLLVALLIRGRRPSDDVRVLRLRSVLRAVLLAGLVAIPAVLLLAKPLHGHPLPLPTQPQPTPPTGATPAVTRPPRPSAPFRVPLPGILYALLILALIGAIAVCAVWLQRRQPGHEVLPPEASLAEGQRAGLQDAVSSGRRALAGLDDARAAIIACYVAMEQSLGAAGADHDAADTPDEFLARAVTEGLVRGAAAGELTALFYEARFSAHDLTAAQRDAAREALEQLAADLRGSS